MTVKQVIVVRTDLNMRKGKIAAQVAHASMKVFLDRKLLDVQATVGQTLYDGTVAPPYTLVVPLDAAMQEWVENSFAKVVLGVDSEAELLRVHEIAKERGVPTALITDVGRTEFHGVPTNTTVAVGPAEVDVIDAITGPAGLVSTRLL